MAKAERSRAVRVYHSIVAIVLLLAGFGLIALGIWLTVNDSQGISNLDFGDDLTNVLRFFLQLHWLSLIVGGFLALAGIFSLIALSRNCVGYTFRVFYVVFAVLILLVLLAACVASSLIITNRYSDAVREVLYQAWETTQNLHPETICAIEERLQCKTFNDYCGGCGDEGENSSFCTPCPTTCGAVDPFGEYYGCYYNIIYFLNDVFLPIAITSGIFSGVMLADIIATCFL